MDERESAELKRDKTKWRVRRRFAVWSFIQLCSLTIFYILVPQLVSKETAEIMSQFNPIIISLIGVFSGIVMVYTGAVTYSDSIKDGQAKNDITYP